MRLLFSVFILIIQCFIIRADENNTLSFEELCIQNKKQLPSAVFDRGTPLNALNLDTQVGSIMPKFKYSEERR